MTGRRRQLRATLREQRRTAFHAARVVASQTPMARLVAALNYAHAVAHSLADDARDTLAREIAALTDTYRRTP